MRYFNYHEFDSPDKAGSGHKMDATFLSMLDEARAIAGIPIHINSGYRTIKHNKKVGGKVTSSHLLGLAADIKCKTSRDRAILFNALVYVGFNRIGIAKTFLHVDIDTAKSQNVYWVY